MADKKEIRKQIEQDTKDWAAGMLEAEEDFDSFSHDQGREMQDVIATNRTLDELKHIIATAIQKQIDSGFDVRIIHRSWEESYVEFEKLRR